MPDARCFAVEPASATVHIGISVHGAQKVPFSYYGAMSEDEVLFPISQQGERKEEFSSWAPARATVILYMPWLPPPGCSCAIPVVTVHSLFFFFFQPCFSSELCLFMFSPSTPAISLLPMDRFGGTAKLNFFSCQLLS